MTANECVEQAKKMAKLLSVNYDFNYVKTQSQSIIDAGRGANLKQWCDGWLLNSMIYETPGYISLVDKYLKQYADEHAQILSRNPHATVFSFQHQYNKKLEAYVELRNNQLQAAMLK